MGQVSQLEDAQERRQDDSGGGNCLPPAGEPLTPEARSALAQRRALEDAAAMRERLVRLSVENDDLKATLQGERQRSSADRADVKKLKEKIAALRHDLRKAIAGGYMPTYDAMTALGRGPRIPPGRVYQGPPRGRQRR